MDKREVMEGLRLEAQGVLESVCDPAVKLVWGDGNLDSQLVLVGEAPGGAEDREGLPFVGQSGKLLNKELESAGLCRKDVYITNVVKCRPLKLQDGRPGNRTPTTREVAAWVDLLTRELTILQPGVILCLGGISASALIHPGFRMNAERGQWFDGPLDTKAMATFHPSYVLRSNADGSGTEVVELFRADIRKAVEAAGELEAK